MGDSLKVLIAVLLVLFLVGLFVFSYLLNKRTPKPEGCQNIGEECEGCQVLMCSHNKSNHNNKEEK